MRLLADCLAYEDGVLIDRPNVDDTSAVIADAARAVADGSDIWWCENHETGPCAPHDAEIAHCFIGHAMNGTGTCRMVHRRLITWEEPDAL